MDDNMRMNDNMRIMRDNLFKNDKLLNLNKEPLLHINESLGPTFKNLEGKQCMHFLSSYRFLMQHPIASIMISITLIRVPRLTETKPKYRNETEIPKPTIKNRGKESSLHLWHCHGFWIRFGILRNWNAYVHKRDITGLFFIEWNRG